MVVAGSVSFFDDEEKKSEGIFSRLFVLAVGHVVGPALFQLHSISDPIGLLLFFFSAKHLVL